MRDSHPHMYTLIDTNMRYNPRTDNALSIEEIAKQCMDAVKLNDYIISLATAPDDIFDERNMFDEYEYELA